MTRKPITALLTPGGGPGLLAMIRSMKESRKYAVRVILADCNPASGNLFLPDVDAAYVVPPVTSDEYLPSLLRLIRRERISVFYSGLDEELPIVARNKALFAEHGCRVLVPSCESLQWALDKAVTFSKLNGVVDMPATYMVDERLDADAVWHRHGGDVLFKVASSRGGRGIYIPADHGEFRFYLEKTLGSGERFLLQERIRGTEYNVASLHTPSGELLYAVSRRKFENRDVKSTTMAACIEERRDVIDQALAAVSTMGLDHGFNNVECIVSGKDDRPYFIEINGGRMAAQDMNIVAAGVGVADLLFDILEGQPVSPVPHPEDGTAILKIRMDVVVNMREIEGVLRADRLPEA